jgi:uncharacterized membrane protein
MNDDVTPMELPLVKRQIERLEDRHRVLSMELRKIEMDQLRSAQARLHDVERELSLIGNSIALLKDQLPQPKVATRVPEVEIFAVEEKFVPPVIKINPQPPAPAPVPAAPSPVPAAPPTPKPAPKIPARRPAPVESPKEALKSAVSKRGFETFFGEKILSRIGITILVFGVVFLVGYWHQHTNALGKLLAGAVAGLGLIGTGMYVHRVPYMRNFIQPLIGGGWAILFFTAFASHHIESVRLVPDPNLGFILLTVVAAGMIGHSLVYRSQLFTSFAYALAFVAMAISQVGVYTLYAQLLLAASLVVLGSVYRWRVLMSLGMLATYGVFGLWYITHLPAAHGMDFGPTLIVLLLYGLVFKTADWLTKTPDKFDLIFQWVNTAVHATLVSILLGQTYPNSLYWYFAPMAALNIMSAIRARRQGELFFHSSLVAAIALAAFAIWNGFYDRPEWIAMGWMIEAAAALALSIGIRAPLFRGISAGLISLALIPLGLGDGTPAMAIAFLVTAMACTISDRVFRGVADGICPEHLIWHVVAAVAGLMILPPGDLALFWLVQAELLLAVGLRFKAIDLRVASAVLFALSVVAFSINPTTPLFVLIAATSLANTYALRKHGVEELPVWSLAAAFAVYFQFRAETIHLFLAWLIQAEVLLGMRFAIDRRALVPVAKLLFVAAAVPLATDPAIGWVLLVTGLAFVNTFVSRDKTSLAWHAPAFLLFGFLYHDATRTMCLAWALYAQALLALRLVIREKSYQFAFGLASLASFGAVAYAGLVVADRFSLFGHSIPLTVPLFVMWTFLGYVDAWVLKKAANEERDSQLFTWVGSIFIALASWNALDLVAIPAAWGMIAVILAEVGVALRHQHLRLQGHILVLLSAVYLFFIDFNSPGLSIASFITVSLYAWGFYWRQGELNSNATSIERFLSKLTPWISWVASALLAWTMWSDFLQRTLVPTGWAALAATLLWLGLRRERFELRWQAILLGVGALIEALAIGMPPDGAKLEAYSNMELFFSMSAMTLLGCGLVAESAKARKLDTIAPFIYAFSGAILLAWLFYVKVDGMFLTIAWGVEGLLLVASGLFFNRRILRYPGLAMLVWCIGKIALVDLMHLQVLPRILSFIGLGAVLLVASFLYARVRVLREKVTP